MKNPSNILQQACTYTFKVQKKIVFPGDEKDLFILEGPGKKKYLLNASYYHHYKLEIGSEIKCRVDKINCSGQVFLEPEHPYYKVGEKYKFLVKEVLIGEDPWGNLQNTAMVEDVYGKLWPCLINSPDNIKLNETKIDCIVERIKKAELFLTFTDFKNPITPLTIGEFYKFRIIEEITEDEIDYYVLKDPHGIKHRLLKEYYAHFNYSVGQLISAKVIDRSPDLSYKIEPINPFYLIGGIYEFKFRKLDLISNELGELTGVLQLEDRLGMINPVAAKPWQIEIPSYKPEKIKCKVVRYKKGKLLLENVEEQV